MSDWYFTGRASIEKFEHTRALGTFMFSIPYANPYMFRDYVISTSMSRNNNYDFNLNVSKGIVVPTFTADADFTVLLQTTSTAQTIGTYEFVAGTRRNPRLRLTPEASRLRIRSTSNCALTINYSDQKL